MLTFLLKDKLFLKVNAFPVFDLKPNHCNFFVPLTGSDKRHHVVEEFQFIHLEMSVGSSCSQR